MDSSSHGSSEGSLVKTFLKFVGSISLFLPHAKGVISQTLKLGLHHYHETYLICIIIKSLEDL